MGGGCTVEQRVFAVKTYFKTKKSGLDIFSARHPESIQFGAMFKSGKILWQKSENISISENLNSQENTVAAQLALENHS